MNRNRKMLALLIAFLLPVATQAVAANQVNQSFDAPARLSLTVEATACNTSPGPQVSLQGTLVPSPLDLDVIFSHVQGAPDPQTGVVLTREIVPVNSPVTAPQQSVIGAMGGNPYLWLQLADAKGRPLTSEIFLGRCDQASFTPTIDLALPTKAIAEVSAADCDASVGPVVGFNGTVEMSPLTAKLIFRDSAPVGGPGPKGGQAAIELVIIPSGPSFQFPQQSLQPGVGGNPLISAQFRLDGGAAVGTETSLGRCQAIAK